MARLLLEVHERASATCDYNLVAEIQLTGLTAKITHPPAASLFRA